MFRFRFSLAGLMGVVLLAAVSCAALRFASPWWASALFSLVLVSSLGAVLVIVFRRGPARAFAVGYVLFCAGYLTFTFGPGFSTYVGPRLLSSRLLVALQPIVQPGTSAATVAGTPWRLQNDVLVVSAGAARYWDLASGQLVAAVPPVDSFLQVGHSLGALYLGLLAGVLAHWLDRSGRESKPPAGNSEHAEIQTQFPNLSRPALLVLLAVIMIVQLAAQVCTGP